MAWKVIKSGVMLDITTGGEINGRPTSFSLIYNEGEIIEQDLTKGLKQRYRDGEEYLREHVQYGRVELRDADDEHESQWKEFIPEDLPDDEEEVPEASGSDDDSADLKAEVEDLKKQLKEAETVAGEAEAHKARADELQSKLDEAELVAASALSYADLSPEALKAEAEKKGVAVTRGDGKDGEPVKADYVRALEEARSGS